MSGGPDPQLNLPCPVKVLWKSPWVGRRGSGEGPQARGWGYTGRTKEGARYVTGRKTPYCYWEARKFPRDLFHIAGPDSSTFSSLFSPVRSGPRIGGSQAFCVQPALFLFLSLSFLTPPPIPPLLLPPSSLTPYPPSIPYPLALAPPHTWQLLGRVPSLLVSQRSVSGHLGYSRENSNVYINQMQGLKVKRLEVNAPSSESLVKALTQVELVWLLHKKGQWWPCSVFLRTGENGWENPL